MKSFYRISNCSYEKPKLIGATKEVCLENFRNVFTENVTYVADRCDQCLLAKLLTMATDHNLIVTNLGNAGSLIYTIEHAITNLDDSEVIYIVEDDYLHLPIAKTLIEEGIRRADYVTLYDHPDKYTRIYNGGEFSKVIKTKSSHWRYTASTCMTFATKVKILKEDLEIWKKYTSEQHPHDHHIFTELGKKQRRLAVCIPGAACHTDLTFSGAIGQITIDSWAIEMMIKEMENELQKVRVRHNCYIDDSSFNNKSGWDKLVAMDALRHHIINLKQNPLPKNS